MFAANENFALPVQDNASFICVNTTSDAVWVTPTTLSWEANSTDLAKYGETLKNELAQVSPGESNGFNALEVHGTGGTEHFGLAKSFTIGEAEWKP